MQTIGRIYTRCTYCNLLAYRDGECDDCGYTGTCGICGDTLEDEYRRSSYPQVCANPHCQTEWNQTYDRR